MRIDGQAAAVNTIQNNGTDVLSKLKPGNVMRAQVLENSDRELLLKLSDGSQVTANSLVQVDASEGEFVNFVFKGMVDGKLLLERMVPGTQQPQADVLLENIKNILENLKLPVTDQNISMALALKNQDLQITAETMSKMIDIMSKNAEVKPDAAAFLTASNMSDNANNIEKLQNLLAGRLKISNDIADLVKLLDGNNISKNADTAAPQTAVRSSETSFAANTAGSGSTVNNPAGTTVTNLNAGNADTTTQSSANNTANANLVKLAGNLLEISTGKAAEIQASPDNINKTMAGITSENTSDGILGNKTDRLVDNNATIKTTNNSVQNGNNISENGGKVNQVAAQISNLIKGGMPLEKTDLTLLNSLNAQFEAMINKGDLTQEQLSGAKVIAKEITDIIGRIQDDSAQQGSEGKQSSVKSFEDAVHSLKNLFVKIDQKSDEINPVKLYKDMDNTISVLKEAIHQLPMAMRETAINIVNNLESNLNFINQLNNYSSYVQLPLSIFSQNTTGELYMLKRGSKAKKLDPSNLTVLISLDSNNIGRIDTLLSIDKRNISTNFRLENSDVFKVLKENHKMLYNSLLEKGYRLVDFTYRLIDEPISIVNFEAEAKKQFIKSSNNIDITI